MRRVRKSKKNKGGLLERTGAQIDGWLQRAVSVLITYVSVFVAGLSVLVLLMLFAGGYFFNLGERVASASADAARMVGFEVSRVTLKGAQHIDEHEIIAALNDELAGPVVGRSLLHFDANTARREVESLGWVRSAAISRLWPNTVHISIEERVPAALWQQPDKGILFLIDAEGKKITRVGGDEFAGLPVILASKRPQDSVMLMRELSKYPKMKTRIVALRHQGDRRWDLKFRNGFTAKLPAPGGNNELEQAIGKLAQMNAGEGALGEKISILDMRDPSLVRLKETN